jgi:DNA polymerase III subunit beta
MRFIVSSGYLLKNLQLIGGVVGSNAVLGVLEDFLFELEGNNLSISASDLETMMRVEIEVTNATNDGRICIPSKILTEYLKNLPDQPITLNVNETDRGIEINSDFGKYKISGENADDFPKEPQPGNASSFNISSIALLESISKTIFAVSNDTLRPAMTGVFFQLEEGGSINFVATDAHRLVQLNRSGLDHKSSDGFIVPKKGLQQMRNVLPAEDTQLEISYNSSHIFITNNKLRMSCRLVDARFPDYKAVIPTGNPYNLVINRTDLISALRRLSIFASKTTSQVVFDIVGNSLTISAQDIDFSYEGKETMTCQYTGEDMKIAFNAKLMIELISNIEGSEIQLELSTPTRAGIFRPMEKNENEDVLMLLMPLMVGV